MYNRPTSIVPSYLNDKALKHMITSYIQDGYTNYDDMYDSHKKVLIAAALGLVEDPIQVMFYSENKINVLHHFMNYMTRGDRDYAADFAENISKNVSSYLEKDVRNLFNEIYEEFERQPKHEEYRLVYGTDNVTGEITYRYER